MSESIWSKTAALPERPALAGGLDVDAAVIGGGMAGVLAAHFLKAAGLRTVLLEASRGRQKTPPPRSPASTG